MRQLAVLATIVIALIEAAGCSTTTTAEPIMTVVPKIEPTPIAPGVEGRLVPRDYIELSAATSGTVAEVLVAQGDLVKVGQVLVRLDDTRLTLTVETARLKVSQANLDLEIAQKPAEAADLAAAQRAVSANQQAVANARGTLSTTVESAQIALRNAQLVLDHAQRDYDHLLDLKSWGHDVDDQIKTAALQLDNARAELTIAQRNANGASARTSQSVAEAQQALAASLAQYEALKRQPEANQVKAAELAVETAKLALKQAETDLTEAVIRASLAGVVAEVNVKPGQAIAPGQALFTLADVSVWVVETSNLTELNVVGLANGHQATVKFDAIPGLTMAGHIDWIALRAQQKQGDVVYTARVMLDESDPRLRWGMTTFVQFEK